MDNQLVAAPTPATSSYEELLNVQSDLIRNQIEIFEGIVSKQCELTGVNPLSQEMAAGALSIKIEKKPRDLLNPKALKHLHLVFSVKDVISKRETRDISSQFGVTLTQVRDFFTSQRTRVRKYARLSKEKVDQSAGLILWRDGVASNSDQSANVEPVPLATIAPMNIDEGSTCLAQDEVPSGMNESGRPVENIFTLMRKEETFVGQVKMLDHILHMHDPSAIDGLLNEGGLMILATWLSQAATEEQTSALYVMLKVLHHLPLEKAPPAHMSAILQSVNKLRFYRTSDLPNRAKSLLSKWSKMFQKNQIKARSTCNTPDELLLKQSINEVIGTGSLDSNKDNSEEAPRLLCNNPNYRKLDSTQPPKMLMPPEDESNKRRGVLSSHARERRKVQMVEHPGQRPVSRSPQVAKSAPAVRSRPLSADDIQKAKLRAQYMQSKHGKISSSPEEQQRTDIQSRSASNDTMLQGKPGKISSSPEEQQKPDIQSTSASLDIMLQSKHGTISSSPEEQQKPDIQSRSASQDTMFPLNNKSHVFPEIIVKKELGNVVIKNGDPHDTLPVEPPWKKCKSILIPWTTPQEMSINDAWCVASGADSKEVEVQRHRTLREKEVIYNSNQDIPPNPREPWDREMDYDDTLTPLIPIEQLPDVEPLEEPPPPVNDSISGNVSTIASSLSSVAGPDLELLAALLKNPDLVFALTSGQAGNMTSDQMMKVLDMVKANSSDLGANAGNSVEVSLPSPTPSTNAFTNVQRPDFSKNPFSKRLLVEDANTYSAQPFTTTTQQLHGQWQPSANLPTHHHQSPQHKFSNNAQYLTSEMMLNTNNVNRASSSVIRNEQRYYPSEHGQGFQSTYQHPNNSSMHNYNTFSGQHMTETDGVRGRTNYDSWTLDGNSPSRRQYPQEQRDNTGYGYGSERAVWQNGYNYNAGVDGAGNRSWNDHRR